VDFLPVGPAALLVEVGDAAAALSLALWSRAGGVAAGEVVPAAGTVLFDGVRDRAALADLLDGWDGHDAPAPGDLVEIPTVYDGPDLEDVAAIWDCSLAEVVDRHTSTEFTASFCGFAPGFAYLTGLPAAWAVPRLAEPRTRVPAGAVGLADTWCGVYPTASPGGWRLLGTADAALWDVTREPPALLTPGTRVRFRDVSSRDSSTQGFVAR